MPLWWHRSGSTLVQVYVLSPDSTKPWPEQVLTYQRCSVAFTWEQFHKNLVCNKCLEITLLELLPYLPGVNEVNSFPHSTLPLSISMTLSPLNPTPNAYLPNWHQGHQQQPCWLKCDYSHILHFTLQFINLIERSRGPRPIVFIAIDWVHHLILIRLYGIDSMSRPPGLISFQPITPPCGARWPKSTYHYTSFPTQHEATISSKTQSYCIISSHTPNIYLTDKATMHGLHTKYINSLTNANILEYHSLVTPNSSHHDPQEGLWANNSNIITQDSSSGWHQITQINRQTKGWSNELNNNDNIHRCWVEKWNIWDTDHNNGHDDGR